MELEHVVWALHTGQPVPPPEHGLVFALLSGAEAEGKDPAVAEV